MKSNNSKTSSSISSRDETNSDILYSNDPMDRPQYLKINSQILKLLIQEKASLLRSKWRQIVTGNKEKRIRDMIREKENEPTYIKLFDKIGFTLGVLNIAICQYFLLNIPSFFWLWYSIVVPLLLIMRVKHFRSLGWQYFLIDFCYFVIILTFLNIFVLNDSKWLFNILFIYTNGPMTIAIIVWRNSLVFHDYDKITSVYIHLLPCMLYYVGRWYKHEPLYTLQDTTVSCIKIQSNTDTSLTIIDFINASGVYLLWQLFYFIKTEVIDKDVLNCHPELITSLRWLSKDTKNPLAKAILKLCRKIGIFQKDENYDHTKIKTLVVFMVSQFIYTLSTFIITPFLFSSHIFHLIWIIFIFTMSVYNGASFYIDIFSARYLKNLEDKASQLFTTISSSYDNSPSNSEEFCDIIDSSSLDNNRDVTFSTTTSTRNQSDEYLYKTD